MTTRAVARPDAADGRPVDWMLPDPVRTPDMQQEPIGSEAAEAELARIREELGRLRSS